MPWGRRFAALKGASSIGGAFLVAKKGGACMANKLTPKQERFCLAYSANPESATQAYKDAGYKGKNANVAAAGASEILKNPKVQERLDDIRDKAASPFIMDIRRRKERLSRMAEEGKDCDAARAIDLLNKMDNLYVQKQEITGAVPVVLADNVRE